MIYQSDNLTRRQMLVLGATAMVGTTAGCSEETSSPGSSDSGDSEDETAADQDQSDTTTEDEQNDGTTESTEDESTEESKQTSDDDSEESENSDEQTDEETADEESEEESGEESEEQTEPVIQVSETYVTPVSSGDVYGVYTTRSTVTTIDGFAVTFDIPNLQSVISLDTDGFKLLLDGQPVSSDRVQLWHENKTDPLDIAIQMRQSIDPGTHTLGIELDNTVIDLPDDRTTATASVEFDVVKPTAELLTDTFPVKEDTEFVIETNIAPGQSIPTQIQSKSGEEPALFQPNEFEVGSDGRGSFTVNFAAIDDRTDASLSGVEANITARPATDDVTLIDQTITIGE